MRIATWNVNSIRARVDRVVDWLVESDIDVLAMQETKCKDEQFPREAFEAAGYDIVAHGLSQWNGVAFASRLPMTDVVTQFAGMPRFQKGYEGDDAPLEARALGVTVDGVRLWSLYVPNGRDLNDPHFDYKLRWLHALQDDIRSQLAADDTLQLALMGDFNIAPFDEDCGDPSMIPGVSTHISPVERARFAEFASVPVTDVVRPLQPEGFTYWDYKQLRFPRNEGLRIDFILGSPAFADRVSEGFIDRDQRKGDAPSDHVPVVVELSNGDVDEDDDRPMFW